MEVLHPLLMNFPLSFYFPENHRDRIVDFEIGFNHAIVCNPKQCYVYNLNHLSSPIIVDLKLIVSFVAMSATNFAFVNRKQGVMVYSYDGRKLSMIDLKCSISSVGFSRNHISLSKDFVAVVDPQDKTVSYLIEIESMVMLQGSETFSDFFIQC